MECKQFIKFTNQTALEELISQTKFHVPVITKLQSLGYSREQRHRMGNKFVIAVSQKVFEGCKENVLLT